MRCTSARCAGPCVSEAINPPRHPDPRVARVIGFFEHLAPGDLLLLGQVYSTHARFRDPFNQVQGLPAIARIFEHMFATLDGPRFTVLDAVAAGDAVFLTWDFDFSTWGTAARPLRIHGASHLVFDAEGRVLSHRDYWDAAQELYEKLPLIGPLMRWLRRRAGAA